MEDLLERVTAIALAFGLDKDMRDICQMLDSMGERLDTQYVLHWVEAIVGNEAVPAQQLTRELAQRSLLPDP